MNIQGINVPRSLSDRDIKRIFNTAADLGFKIPDKMMAYTTLDKVSLCMKQK